MLPLRSLKEESVKEFDVLAVAVDLLWILRPACAITVDIQC